MYLSFNIIYFLLVVLSLYVASGEVENLGKRTTVKICTVGFESTRADRILHMLLDQPEVILDSSASSGRDVADTGAFRDVPARLLSINDESALVATCNFMPSDKYSDAAFLFLDGSDLFNENKVILRFLKCFKSVIGSGRQSPLVIVFTGPASATNKIELLLRESWILLLDDESVSTTLGSNDNLFSRFSVRILLTPFNINAIGDVNPDAQKSVAQVLELLNPKARCFEDCFGTEASSDIDKEIGTYETADAAADVVGRKHSIGIEAAQEGVDVAVQWALQATNSSIGRLTGRMEEPEDFAHYIENLVHSAENILQDHFLSHISGSTGGTSSVHSGATLVLAKKDLHYQLFQRLLPLYKRQIQLARGEVAKSFNSLVFGEDSVLVPSINVMQDLNELVHESLRNFSSLTYRLTPSIAPRSSWNSLFERFEYSQTLKEYSENREAEFRKVGVLPRGGLRPLIDLSVHAFVPHPLGMRDYRQDVLGGNRDKLYYDDELAGFSEAEAGSVKTGLARRALQREVSQLEVGGGSRALFPLAFSRVLGLAGQGTLFKRREQSEFAREMLMFPLSIKNPNVAMAGGRSGHRKRRSSDGSTGAPKKDPNRESLGPERFITWGVAPMDEAKRNIDTAIEKNKHMQKVTEGVGSSARNKRLLGKLPDIEKKMDEALNIIPYFQKGFYEHPPINYGPKYSPSRQSRSPGN